MRLAVLGASGHGKVVAEAAMRSGWKEIVFFDDAWPKTKAIGPWSVAGGTKELTQQARSFDGVIIGIGDNATRLGKARDLEAGGIALATVVHPTAIVSPMATIGAGSALFAGAIVNPFARLGRACVVNTGASVDHDCELGDGVHVSPGAHLGGNVIVGEGGWVGIGAVVKQGIRVGHGAIVGAGAVVIRDVPDGVTVVGVPAEPLRR